MPKCGIFFDLTLFLQGAVAVLTCKANKTECKFNWSIYQPTIYICGKTEVVFFIEIRKQEFNLATIGSRREAMRLIGKRPSLYSENIIQLISHPHSQ